VLSGWRDAFNCIELKRMNKHKQRTSNEQATNDEVESISIWREEIQNRNRLLDLAERNSPRFGGKKFKIEIDSSIWREEIQNRNRLLDLAGRNSK
jgi:hypothetical protein